MATKATPAKLQPADRARLRDRVEAWYRSEKERIDGQYPEWAQKLESKLREAAYDTYGVRRDVREWEKLREQIDELVRKRDAVKSRIEAKMPFEEVGNRSSCPGKQSLCDVVRYFIKQQWQAYLQKSAVGKDLQRVREMRDRKLDLIETLQFRGDVEAKGVLDFTKKG